MQKVEPIRDTKLIKRMEQLLLGKDKTGRYRLLFVVGINIALRVSDILGLRYSDIFHENGSFREYYTIVEQKTKKTRKIKLNDIVKKELKDFALKLALKGQDYFFFSPRDHANHLHRTRVWAVFHETALELGLEDIGTHTLRKTFGYHYYLKTKDLATLQLIFGHQNSNTTRKYIGINQDKIDSVYQEVGELYSDKGGTSGK